MKKLFGLLSVCLALPCLSACSFIDEVKTYHYDENGHWRSIELCDSVDVRFQKAPHDYSSEDNVCTVCGCEKTVEDSPIVIPTEVAFLCNYEQWLLDLNVQEITEVKTTFEYNGVAPGNFKKIQRIYAQEDIENFLTAYQHLKMTRISKEEAEVDGGSSFSVSFILKDGRVKKLYFNNGVYDGNKAQPEVSFLPYFKVGKLPTLEDFENVDSSYSFITYNTAFELFTKEGVSLGEHNSLSAFEFVEVAKAEVELTGESEYYMVGDVGTLYVHSDYLFSMEKAGETVYYKIVRGMHFGNFGEIKKQVFGVTEGVLYRLKEDKKSAEVYGYETGSYGHIIIQSEYFGVPVTSIADYAFADTNVGKIVLPDTITDIGNWAFFRCHYLKSINIPSNVVNIGDYAFHTCSQLTKIELPDSVLTIGEGAFRFCSALVELKMGKGVTSIGDFAFDNCSCLAEIELPEGLSEIGVQLFLNCEKLSYIKIPNQVSTIQASAFGYCDSLKSVVIGSGVTEICSTAFYVCKSLETVYYQGTSESWNQIAINKYNDFNNAEICYYSEQQPTKEGSFWHYDQEGNPVKW